MANYITLYVGEEKVQWRWDVPKLDYFILELIFEKKDKKILLREPNNPKEGYECVYLKKIVDVKKRLKKFGFTLLSTKKLISEMWKMDVSFVNFAIDYLNEENYCFEEKNKLKLDKINKLDFEEVDIGGYHFLFEVLRFLNKIEENEVLLLNLEDYWDTNKKTELEKLDFITEDISEDTKLDRKYLLLAKINFTKGEFDMIYIQLIIVLESKIKKYILKQQKKLLNKGLNIEKMAKRLSLIDMFKFAIIFLGKKRLKQKTLEDIDKIYNQRNNIIHSDMRKFNPLDVSKDLQNFEKILKIINSLD